MAISLVQSRSVAGVSLAFSGNVTSGNLLVVIAGDAAVEPGTTFAISDTQGNVWTALTIIDATGISGGLAQLFYAVAKASGATTVSLTTASTLPQLAIHEFSSVATLDVSASATGTGLAQDSGPALTAQAAELLFGYTLVIAPSILSPGVGWTQAELIGVNLLTEYQTVSSVGTYDATTSTTNGKAGTSHWATGIATFFGSGVVTPRTLATMGAGA